MSLGWRSVALTRGDFPPSSRPEGEDWGKMSRVLWRPIEFRLYECVESYDLQACRGALSR